MILRLFSYTISLYITIVKCQNARGKRTLVEREVGLATIPGLIINAVDESDHV